APHARGRTHPRSRSGALRRYLRPADRDTDRVAGPRRARRPRPGPCRRGARPRTEPDGGHQMKFVDEFRDAALGRALANQIRQLADPGRHYKIMEVCGGHTHSIYRYGVADLLPENVELVH